MYPLLTPSLSILQHVGSRESVSYPSFTYISSPTTHKFKTLLDSMSHDELHNNNTTNRKRGTWLYLNVLTRRVVKTNHLLRTTEGIHVNVFRSTRVCSTEPYSRVWDPDSGSPTSVCHKSCPPTRRGSRWHVYPHLWSQSERSDRTRVL